MAHFSLLKLIFTYQLRSTFFRGKVKLHITPTALTRRVQKLEAYLGLKLLDRTTRRVEMTAVGREFLPQARAIVNEMTSDVGRLKDMSLHAKGNFTLACVPSMAAHMLPQLIRQYADTCPGNRIRLLDAASYEVREAVLNHQAEIGIAVNGEVHPDLIETPLFDDPLVFICRDTHPLHGKESVTWTDMREADLIVVSNFMATRVLMDYQLAKHGIRLNGNYEVRHHATAINLVAAGVGCASLPSSTLLDGDRMHVRKIKLIGPIVKRKIALLRHKNTSLSPAAQAFFELIQKANLKEPRTRLVRKTK
ncbi:LysR family transcriptional regulator [Limnohabitans sp.]|uniref:LysR family transcriptional regulator n=1 Tax=Limnohabitans sp. TaxID=1907725 RepID=UPI00286F1B40|nr:LysR family transcriptional regulator [Limnohabitans sp.]